MLRSRILFAAPLLTVAAAAVVLRGCDLDLRPLHTDEAVHAVKLSEFIDAGTYRYDPVDYHGPVLYDITRPLLLALGASSSEELTETRIGIVPAVFGVGLVLLLLFARKGWGWGGALWAALFTAVSPFMVYYSRYYIHETLLVFFTFAVLLALWRYRSSPRPIWVLLIGVGIGFMLATKETAVIALACMALAWLTVGRPASWRGRWSHVAGGVAVAGLVSFCFYSSFFTNMRGPLDAVRSYAGYLNRAAGAGHEHPPMYYLGLLTFQQGGGLVWTEALVLVLALAGCITALTERDKDRAAAGRFLAVYTLAMVVVYSAIPYKTPWSMMGFYHGLILLAGLGAAGLVRWAPKGVPRITVMVLLAAGASHLAVQSVRANFRYHSDSRNPYAYVQTSTDVMRLVARMQALCAVHPDGQAMFVQVFGTEYWPLPWYLRSMTRVGYWPDVTVTPQAPVVIAGPAQADTVASQLGDRYQPEFYGLRDGVILNVFIEKGLWEKFLGGVVE